MKKILFITLVLASQTVFAYDLNINAGGTSVVIDGGNVNIRTPEAYVNTQTGQSQTYQKSSIQPQRNLPQSVTLEISGNEVVKTVTCNNNNVNVSGNDNRVTLQGYCNNVNISGNGNGVVINSAVSVYLDGNDNTASLRKGVNARIQKSGNDNQVTRW